MAEDFLNRVRMLTSDTGNTGQINFGAAYSNAFCTEIEAGAVDGHSYRWVCEEGTDFMIFTGVYTASGRKTTVATIELSKIGGTAGTTRMTLASNAQLRCIGSATDFAGFITFLADQSSLLTLAQKATARGNIGITILRGYLAGLTLSTAGSSSTFGIAAGLAADSTAADYMSLASAYTKTTSAWAVGTGNGSLDTGSIAANAWYHVHLIKRPDTGVVDVLISTSATSPTLPTNYTLSRRIGSMLTDGSSKWTAFSQNGNEFLWAQGGFNDISSSTLGTTAAFFSLHVPTGLKVNALFRGYVLSATVTANIVITSPDEADNPPGTPTGNYSAEVQATSQANMYTLNVRTDTSAEVRFRSSAASTSVSGNTYGWIDTRGRDA